MSDNMAETLNIAVCGAPLVGKSELLIRLCKLSGSPLPDWFACPDRFARGVVETSGRRIQFSAATGSILYREQMFTRVLWDADLVTYVISADPVAETTQVETFQHYLRIAERLGKTWSHIPWIVVLNKTDKGTENPLKNLLPPILVETALHCVATNGRGIEQLWKELTKQTLSGVIKYEKPALRCQLNTAIKNFPPPERATASTLIVQLFQQNPIWQTSRAVLLFAPMPSEPDITPLLADALSGGKLLALPRFNVTTKTYEAVQVTDLARDLVMGSFQLLEPSAACSSLALNRLDLALVPGLGFDARGHRLGRGKGYYDRLLAGFAGVKVGVAFDLQVVPEVPVEPHDIALDAVVTPTRWIEAKRV